MPRTLTHIQEKEFLLDLVGKCSPQQLAKVEIKKSLKMYEEMQPDGKKIYHWVMVYEYKNTEYSLPGLVSSLYTGKKDSLTPILFVRGVFGEIALGLFLASRPERKKNKVA